MPVVLGDSQSTLPQAQASELAADPSDTVHGACLLHRFSDCLQNMPVVLADSQSILPQAQASELAADPSDTEQVGGDILVLACKCTRALNLKSETRNLHCRKHRLQSWQQIRRTRSMQVLGILRHWFLLK